MKNAKDMLAIGDVAERTGLAISAIRFYETKGLVKPIRNSGGQRRFPRSAIRRLSFIMIAQQLGLSIAEIEQALASLPEGRTPTAKDWQRISKGIRQQVTLQIAALEKIRDNLDGCIGCGCLSLKNCALYNADDHIRSQGVGPGILLGS
jgi:MerR family redox-sensitive transcriptional activator SoxR